MGTGAASSSPRPRGRPITRLDAGAGNALDAWRIKQRLSYQQLGKLYGAAATTAWHHCQPLGDPQFRNPHRYVTKIFTATGIPPEAFYTLRLVGDEAAR